jgi:hypothetical protein
MIIGLTGYAQSGKDTVANYLVKQHGFTRVAFADKIRDVLYEMNPIVNGEPLQITVDVEGWDKAKQRPSIRLLLQNLGVAARKHIDEDVWIRAALSASDLNTDIVVTDVRFLNEADRILFYSKMTGQTAEVWRIERPGVTAVNGHVSEHDMANYEVDQVFVNNGSIEDLEQSIKVRLMANL